MVKYSDGNWLENIGFSPFLNFFMVKLQRIYNEKNISFSPFLNFFMVKFKLSVDLVNNRFSP
ncbi:hypothetical protein D3O35_06960, partial [Campylobacter jejuni]|nr:hypothetical protein [Campylobacter jejuni]